MSGGVRVRPGGVNARMDDEGRCVDRIIALDNIALVIAADQVRGLDLAEVDAERIDPKVVRQLGVTCRDMSGDPLIEAEPAEQPKPSSQAFLAVPALVGDVIDVGEAVAQEFSLALPSFPRSPGAALEIDETPPDGGPFAALSRLADRQES